MSRRASGLWAWALQRITAVYLVVFFGVMSWHLLTAPPAHYQAWRDWLGQGWVSVGTLLFFVALAIHAWVGVRDVILDYVHPLLLRVTLLTLFGATFVASGLWAAKLIFRVSSQG